ncbi:hypothetical protein VNO77_03173 [Canavalia gladiata]|uniref:Uncharacterized protein n=1 Tax=Canavalia gladiata TaxID=3824 RepID=A0AAN9R3L1_CANGL
MEQKKLHSLQSHQRNQSGAEASYDETTVALKQMDGLKHFSNRVQESTLSTSVFPRTMIALANSNDSWPAASSCSDFTLFGLTELEISEPLETELYPESLSLSPHSHMLIRCDSG